MRRSPLSLEDSTAAVEAERRRLATLLQHEITEPLKLLLAQANAYEQSVGSNSNAHMAISVLAALARQVIQQARDLETSLVPETLEALGLEAALQTLANQVTRSQGISVDLRLERLNERLPDWLELLLFRSAQEALAAAQQANASHLILTLQCQKKTDERGTVLVLELQHDGASRLAKETFEGGTVLGQLAHRIEQAGGQVVQRFLPSGRTAWALHIPLPDRVPLTLREQEVLRCLVEGLSNKEIAQRLCVSPRTVNFHLDNLYAKLNVSTRTEAAVYALLRLDLG